MTVHNLQANNFTKLTFSLHAYYCCEQTGAGKESSNLGRRIPEKYRGFCTCNILTGPFYHHHSFKIHGVNLGKLISFCVVSVKFQVAHHHLMTVTSADPCNLL